MYNRNYDDWPEKTEKSKNGNSLKIIFHPHFGLNFDVEHESIEIINNRIIHFFFLVVSLSFTRQSDTQLVCVSYTALCKYKIHKCEYAKDSRIVL